MLKEFLTEEAKATLILQYWREINGGEATRQKILDALNACGLKYAALVLEAKWEAEVATRRSDRLDTSQAGHTLYLTSSSNPPISRVASDNDINNVVNKLNVTEYEQLFRELGLSVQHKEAAEKKLDPKRHATLILEYWRQKNGEQATTQRILEALVSAGLKYTAWELKNKWANEC